MREKFIVVGKKSNIPILGIDFTGIIDRGTNIIEIKPITICNLKCKYCFVRSGDYETNFSVESRYILENVERIINYKDCKDIEIHIAPYGEILLYKELFTLIKGLWGIEGVKTISMQTNGLLITPDIIKELESVRLSRINISLNTLNDNLANLLCNCDNYNVKKLLKNIESLLNSNIDVLIAPVWFPGKNDDDIEDIIQLVLKYRKLGYSESKIRLGIQKYLTYKTGRRLKNVRPKTWDYFYKQLTKLEHKYNIKLKLGPNDFGICKTNIFSLMPLPKKGELINILIVSRGRWNYEYIGKINDLFGVKVLLNKSFNLLGDILDKEINVRVLKASETNNTITAHYPP